jgi:hypothetical protein
MLAQMLDVEAERNLQSHEMRVRDKIDFHRYRIHKLKYYEADSLGESR